MGTFHPNHKEFHMASRPTIIDVAKLAGLSKTTVSRVINGDTSKVSDAAIERVEQAIKTLGYEYNLIASSLRTARSNVVMLMIPDITNPFWPEVARGIQDAMELADYSVIFANIDWNPAREKEFLKIAMRTRVDGILINPIQASEEEILATRIPSVILGIRPGYKNIDMVGSDSFNATYQALDYLYQLGHRRIGFLMGRSEISSSSSRLNAFHSFFQEHTPAPPAELIVEVTFDNYGGIQGMAKLLELQEPPTAVIANNDLIALGALQVASEKGYKVPDDLSIMGIDDVYAASLAVPPLSTMRKQKYEIGKKAAEILHSRLSGENNDPPCAIKFPCQLVVRGSARSIL